MTTIDGIKGASAKATFEKMAGKTTLNNNAFKTIKKIRNMKALTLQAALAGGAIGVAGTAVRSLFDSDKGSAENRKECAIEHLKNDAGFFAKAGLLGGAAYVISKHKSFFKPLVTDLGKVAGKLVQKGSKLVPALGKVAQKILKNPTKAGVGALIGGGVIYITNELFKNVFKSGQIDQKYNDKAQAEAKAEAQEKAVKDEKKQRIIEQLLQRQEYIEMLKNGKNPVMEYYKNGGKGVNFD